MDAADPPRSQAAGPNASDWHWLWEPTFAGLCLAAIVAIVLLNDRIPATFPWPSRRWPSSWHAFLTFGRRIIRSPEFDWRTVAFVATLVGLWVVALWASPIAVAAIPALYPLVFSTMPLMPALLVTTAVNVTPLTLTLLTKGTHVPYMALGLPLP